MTPPVSSNRTVAILWQPYGCVKSVPGAAAEPGGAGSCSRADGALADRRRAHDLDPENVAPVYSSAFVLEREGRPAEAAEAWRKIVDFATERGSDLTAAWRRRELQRLAGLLAERKDTGG